MIESPEIGCGKCIYRRYDSWHDESWCEHEPPPEGLCPRKLVDVYDRCEYYEAVVEDLYKSYYTAVDEALVCSFIGVASGDAKFDLARLAEYDQGIGAFFLGGTKDSSPRRDQYVQDIPCWMCGSTPTAIESRFGYVYCEKCAHIPPVAFGKVKNV